MQDNRDKRCKDNKIFDICRPSKQDLSSMMTKEVLNKSTTC